MLSFEESYPRVLDYLIRKLVYNRKYNEISAFKKTFDNLSEKLANIQAINYKMQLNDIQIHSKFDGEISFFKSDLYMFIVTDFFNYKLSQIEELDEIEIRLKELLTLQPNEKSMINLYSDTEINSTNFNASPSQLNTKFYSY